MYTAGNTTTLTNSSISGNSATVTGDQNNGGLGLYNYGTLTITGSTIANNTGTITGTAGFNGGGAIYDSSGTSTYLNSTLSGNKLTINGSFPTNGGGAIFNDASSGSLSDTTIADNSVNQSAGAISPACQPSLSPWVLIGITCDQGSQRRELAFRRTRRSLPDPEPHRPGPRARHLRQQNPRSN